MTDFFANGQESSQLTYKPSTHLFTDPIRYFKANDPYYWEVDNIPLKQVQENILWLKDQVGTTIEGVDDAVTRDNFVDLRPRAVGDSNIVTVDPGRFMGRVNDAYGTGIAKLVNIIYSDYAKNKYHTDVSLELPDSVLRKLIGNTITNMIGNNGLYDLLQHHVTNHTTNNSTEWNFTLGTFLQNNEGLSNIYDIPKIKLALWKQDTTSKRFSSSANAQVDLQQMSVDFTRAWGAPFRTALVNVENQLSIAIPPFDEDDYVNNSSNLYVPSTRIDLLFIYTKPIDASSTFIAKPNGKKPMEITTPQLGIVKGAGVVALNGAGQHWSKVGEADTSFLDDGLFTNNRKDPDDYFKALKGLGTDDTNQISSPLADQNQDVMGTSGVYGNFPSPDDLMNLSPYIVDRLVGTKNLALVGQSILPIAYIFVTKDQVSITNDHILDIRPFFRTTELTYNERAGIAASNPPASLANPFVTNSDIVHRLDVFSKNLPAPPDPPFIAPLSRGLVAAGSFKVGAARSDKSHWSGDQLNILIPTAQSSTVTIIEFAHGWGQGWAWLDTSTTSEGAAPGYIVRTNMREMKTHRTHTSASRWTYAYVTDKTQKSFKINHPSRYGSDNVHLHLVSFEVYDYSAVPEPGDGFWQQTGDGALD